MYFNYNKLSVKDLRVRVNFLSVFIQIVSNNFS